MARHFPYVSAAVATAVVGAITSVVWAAQVPVMHPGAPATNGGSVTVPGAAHAPNVASNAATTGAAGGTTPGVPAPIPVAPTPVAPNAPGSGPAALPPGFQQSAAFGEPGMSQAGQPPFGEMFYSMQTYMNQPGMPDYYDRLGINPTALQASEGYAPFTSYQGQVGSQATTTTTTNPTATTPPNSIGQHYTPTNTGSAVGFYRGFGPGNPNWGFFAGFTTPR